MISNQRKKRLLIFTDSLGMARIDLPIEKTWTSRILHHFGYKYEIYLTSGRALTSNDFVWKISEITLLDPDIILIQIGICDCVRRVLPKKLLLLLSHYHVFNSLIHPFLKRFHYHLTRLYYCKYVTEEEYGKNLKTMLQYTQRKHMKIGFIRISQPGTYFIKTIYNCENDIQTYNLIMDTHIKKFSHASLINPYGQMSPDKYLMKKDGHHFSTYGHQMVYRAVSQWLHHI